VNGNGGEPIAAVLPDLATTLQLPVRFQQSASGDRHGDGRRALSHFFEHEQNGTVGEIVGTPHWMSDACG
jgi:hypothetical protein